MIVMDLEWNSGVGDGKSLAEILQIGAVSLVYIALTLILVSAVD